MSEARTVTPAAVVPPSANGANGLVVTEPPRTLLTAIISAAKDPAVDVAKLRALLEMQERLEEREAKRAFTAAFARLSKDLPRVKKNGTISLGKDKAGVAMEVAFAKWEDMDKIIRPFMAREGFTLSFDSAARPGDGGGLIVTGTLEHGDGHTRTASMPLPLDTGPGRNNLQAMGSTLSYGKRYCAEMLLNIVREGQDDDARSMSFIAASEKEQLIDLMKDTGANTKLFLEWLKVPTLDELPATRFAEARSKLLEKKAKIAGDTKGTKP